MESHPDLLNKTPASFHNIDHAVSEQLSPTTRLLIIIILLSLGLGVAYYQVSDWTNDHTIQFPAERLPVSSKFQRLAKVFLLNTVSGILIMTATSFGAYDLRLARLKADMHLHDLLDPQVTQWTVDCLLVHVVHWVRYSSGYETISNFWSHTYELHLWALSLEFVAALAAFIMLVLVPMFVSNHTAHFPRGKSRRKFEVALVLAAIAYASFQQYWICWMTFALLYVAHIREISQAKLSSLPYSEPKGRKGSSGLSQVRSWEEYEFWDSTIACWLKIALGLYLLSAGFYGHDTECPLV